MLIKIITSGAVVNSFLIIIGGTLGFVLKSGIPERIRGTLMHGMALCVMFIGISGLFRENINTLNIVLSCGLGAAIGEIINLDALVNRAAGGIESIINKRKKGSGQIKIAEGFATATLIFCVGAMTVVGSIESGIAGDNTTLYSKSMIDCITAVVLASTLGIGVAFSAFPVLIVEGGLTILAFAVQPILTEGIISHMSVVGSLLIIALSLNMLELTKIKIMNLLPAVFMPMLLCFILK